MIIIMKELSISRYSVMNTNIKSFIFEIYLMHCLIYNAKAQKFR